MYLSLIALAIPALAGSPGTWSATGSLNVIRAAQAQVSLADGRVLVAGGTSGTAPVASAEIYDSVQGIWTLTGSMSTPRTGATAVLLPNGKVLVAGGSNGTSVLATAELFDPTSATWSLTGTMNVARSLESLSVLPSGLVLAVGGCPVVSGCSYSNALASAELYNPATGSWTVTGSINDAYYGLSGRFSHAALVLPNGKVLVTPSGGTNNSVNPAVYDPATGAWVMAYCHLQYAYNGNLLQLSDGRIMMLGGYIGSTQGTEFFDPATNTWTAGPAIGVWSTGFSVVSMANGQMLLAGGGYTQTTGSGRGGGGSRQVPNANAKVFTPSANAFATTGAGIVVRSIPKLAALPNGEVLAVGGAASAVTELYEPTSTISTSPSSVSFGSQVLFQTTASQSVMLTNLQSIPLGITSVVASAGFAASSACGASLPAGQSCSIAVTFDPSTSGPISGTLTLTLSDAPFTTSIPLSGTGVAQALSLSASSLNLTAVAGSSSTATLTVTNSIGNPSPVAIGISGAGFSQTNTCPASLGAGLSCMVIVTFAPASTSPYSGSLNINGTGGSQIVALSGSGAPVALTISPLSIDFGTLVVNDDTSKSITVSNASAVSLSVKSAVGSGAPFSVSNGCKAALTAGASCTISVKFAPTAIGSFTGTVTVTDSTGTVTQVGLTGVAGSDSGNAAAGKH